MLINMTITEFLAELKSDSPAPGGGSAAALAGAVGAAAGAVCAEAVVAMARATTLAAAADRNLDMFIGTLWRWRTGTFRFGRSFPWPKCG